MNPTQWHGKLYVKMHLRTNILVLEGVKRHLGIQRTGTGGCALEYILGPNMVAMGGGCVKAGADIKG